MLHYSPRMEPAEERRLVSAAQAGDAEAFNRLVHRYQDHLYRLMVRACHHPQDAEEVASAAFLRAYERLSQFENRSSFVQWLGRIGVNLCFRRRARHQVATVPLGGTRGGEQEAEQSLEADEPSPEEAALRLEMKQKIQSAISALPEPDQTVLRLRDIEQLTAQEVSARTGLTVPAVKARLHRARLRLRERLNDYLLEN